MKNYLVLPINNDVEVTDIVITSTKDVAYGLSVRLDAVNPKYYEYIDLAFLGEIKSVSLKENQYSFSNTKPSVLYKEPLRPKIHYTPSNGWNNDPNGMLFYNGVYHMFYQHNPAGNTWGNMHWGHATSTDLIHFKEEDIALRPDYLGAMYSGSAIVDYENVSGLKENENNPIILFYTAAGYRFNQCVAYSTDNGKTFKKYKHNPIIKFITLWNRDPKVIKCDELNCYIMALYLDGPTFAIFKSQNLLDWTELQRVDIENDYECPDIFKIKIEGTNEYAYILQAACGSYLIGKIKDGKFVFDSKPHKTLYGNYIDYTAQSYSNLGNRIVQVYWQKSKVYPNMPWGSNLSLPQEVTLHKNEKGELELHSYIAKEFESVEKEQYFGTKPSFDCGFDIKADIEVTPSSSINCFGLNIPLPDEFNTGHLKLRLIVDTIGVTIYINDGVKFATFAGLPDYNLKPLDITDGSINQIEVYSIKSFY